MEKKSLDTGDNKLNTKRNESLLHRVNYEWLKRHDSAGSRLHTGRDK